MTTLIQSSGFILEFISYTKLYNILWYMLRIRMVYYRVSRNKFKNMASDQFKLLQSKTLLGSITCMHNAFTYIDIIHQDASFSVDREKQEMLYFFYTSLSSI